MLMQVSGRAGRKEKQGTVVVQSNNPWHSVIRYVMDNNFDEMFDSQLSERRQFAYPPYYRLINLTLQHKEKDLLNKGSEELAKLLKEKFGARILGPEYPLVSRVRNRYLKKILLKIEKKSDITYAKKLLSQAINVFSETSNYRSIRVVIDVDPQ